MSPADLASLLREVRHAKSSGLSVRLVGGNTGPGVYKDWPQDIDVLVGTSCVPDLTGITSREVQTKHVLSNLSLLCVPHTL